MKMPPFRSIPILALSVVLGVACSSEPSSVLGGGDGGGIGEDGTPNSATDGCAGQPRLTGVSGTEFFIDAFPGGQDNYESDFIGVGACTSPGPWVADTVVCFVPENDCTFDVEVVPSDLDLIAVLAMVGNLCQSVIPSIGQTECLGAAHADAPGDPVELPERSVPAGKTVCIVTRSSESPGQPVELALRGMDDCGDLL